MAACGKQPATAQKQNSSSIFIVPASKADVDILAKEWSRWSPGIFPGVRIAAVAAHSHLQVDGILYSDVENMKDLKREFEAKNPDLGKVVGLPTWVNRPPSQSQIAAIVASGRKLKVAGSLYFLPESKAKVDLALSHGRILLCSFSPVVSRGFPHFRVSQCWKCFRHGHTRARCNVKQPCCPTCAQPASSSHSLPCTGPVPSWPEVRTLFREYRDAELHKRTPGRTFEDERDFDNFQAGVSTLEGGALRKWTKCTTNSRFRHILRGSPAAGKAPEDSDHESDWEDDSEDDEPCQTSHADVLARFRFAVFLAINSFLRIRSERCRGVNDAAGKCTGCFGPSYAPEFLQNFVCILEIPDTNRQRVCANNDLTVIIAPPSQQSLLYLLYGNYRPCNSEFFGAQDAVA
ncbi:hypothetical protein B0H13DRAFT_1850663 [Mycena leptocephala]|nr:hypothetical protein B0H13DRAFT_1850663 [Mycena leptocephala]